MSQQTALYPAHIKWGARIVDFAGWQMPVQYKSILEEHHAVRKAAGLFDISHMGEFWLRGKGSGEWLNQMFTNDVGKLQSGAGQYTLMLNDQGGVIDDLILYQIDEDLFFMVVNASKIEEDFDWMVKHLPARLNLENKSDATGAVALQGPVSEKILKQSFSNINIPKRNQIVKTAWEGFEIWVARTGYTGEDGFEIFFPAEKSEKVWEHILLIGKEDGCVPVGLGARDTLRLEACLPLNGNDLAATITPLEAGLGKFVALTKSAVYPGKKVLEQTSAQVPKRVSVAFITENGPPPRAHYQVFSNEKHIGEVTSGTLSPTLGKGIGMALVEREFSQVGTTVQIDIRGKKISAQIQPKPLYKKTK
jgi:aminomethyltransferase